jgi:DNA-binding transcriptional MerR regulator
MDNIKKTLEVWLNELNNFSFKKYEELPDIELYMDQVVTFLEKQIKIFQNSSLDKQITSSMINNYVKGEVVSAPIAKKYNREHLAAIEEVISLKQVLSIAEVKQILNERYKDNPEKGEIFNSFNELQTEKITSTVNEAFKHLNDIDDNDTKALIDLALDFSLSAVAYINIAKKILFLTRVYDELNKPEEEKDKDKKKDKEN